MKVKFQWDGEKIKQIATEEEKKYSTKDILNALNNVRSQLNQMQQQKSQMEQQFIQLETNIRSATVHEKELAGFENKCIELQKDKLKFLIGKISKECKEKAETSAAEIIGKDPSAYTDAQKKQIPYLNYQRLLATNEKVADKISPQIISKYLFDEPIFDDPFKD